MMSNARKLCFNILTLATIAVSAPHCSASEYNLALDGASRYSAANYSAREFRFGVQFLGQVQSDVMTLDEFRLGGSALDDSSVRSAKIYFSFIGAAMRATYFDTWSFGLTLGKGMLAADQEVDSDAHFEFEGDGGQAGVSIGLIPWRSDDRRLHFGATISAGTTDANIDAIARVARDGSSFEWDEDTANLGSGAMSFNTITLDCGATAWVSELAGLSVVLTSGVGAYWSWANLHLDRTIAGQDVDVDWSARVPLYLRGGIEFSTTHFITSVDVLLGGRVAFAFAAGIAF